LTKIFSCDGGIENVFIGLQYGKYAGAFSKFPAPVLVEPYLFYAMFKVPKPMK
jgi:hypothetical protein